MVNKIKVAVPKKEQIEYEEAKKDFRIATAKARLHSVGIDPSKISQQVLDKVMRIFDDMDHVQQDTQQNISKLQRDAEAAIQKVNLDANQKFGEMQKKYQDLIESLNKEDIYQIDVKTQTDVQPGKESAEIQAEVQPEEIKEEVREKTQEEKVSEITDILLRAMRGQINEKVNEIMCIVDKKIGETTSTTGENKESINEQKEESEQRSIQEDSV